MESGGQHGPGGLNGSAGMSKAERFEYEKRRIVDSCFNKKDDDGSLIESYITHIRIIEDAAFPASPPPPNSNPATKKPRLVIVAVRKSGRVRMHKARENANGTFSIGKTWMLDDLSAIQSFTGLVPQNAEEEQQKQWAGGTGFIVTLGKSYYWQANTQKEKQFFIASLVKIYTKYTGGKVPQLSGFEPREMDQLLGGAQSLPPSQTQSPSTPIPPIPSILQVQQRSPARDPSREPGVRSQPSRDAMQRPPGQPSPIGGPSPVGAPSPSTRPVRSRRMESPSDSFDSITPQQSQPALRRVAAANHSQESFGSRDDTSSLPPRSRGGMNGMPSAPGRFPDRSVTPTSQRATTPDSTFSSSRDIPDDAPPVPAPLTLPPERRRPPMPTLGDSFQRAENMDENIIPAPLASPGMRRDDLRPPTRSSERGLPRDRDSDTMGNLSPQPIANGNQAESPRGVSDLKKSEVTQSPLSAKSAAPLSALPSPIVRTPDKADAEEETRPGLGPMIKQKSPPSEKPETSPGGAKAETRPGLGSMIKSMTPITSPIEPPAEPAGEARPGLGPMIRKKSRPEIANAFLNAAKSASALSTFKPRAGGAAEKLREAAAKAQAQEHGPDGITGVIPAPGLVRATGSNSNLATPTQTPVETPSAPKEKEVRLETKGLSSKADGDAKAIEKASQGSLGVENPSIREAKRQKPASETMQKELAALGIDPIILGGKGNDLIAAWDEFGWAGEGVHTKNIDHMKEEIERELNKVQAGGWLNRLEEEDERVEAIKAGLDRCIDECDELDGLLTLYLVELSTLDEDIAFIEAQSQGLQVQAANQKLLQAELQALLDTISISSSQLEGLSQASLESTRGLEQIESSLVILYKALLTIDPSVTLSGARPSEDGKFGLGPSGGISNSEIGRMQVLQEKKDVYKNEAAMFLRRLRPFLQVKFAAAIDETRKVLEREKGSSLARAGKVKLDTRNHDLARDMLWRYSPLMLFTREVDRPEWEELMKTYEAVARPLYQDEFRDAVFAWKRTARKPAGDEGDILFTSQIEKQGEGIATTARKLTVKRSQTLAKSLRAPIGDGGHHKGSIDKTSDGRLPPFEVFGGVLEEMLPVVSMEQNFIVKFFHVTSLEQYDFPEAVAMAPPDERRGGDLRRPRVMEPNRDLAKLVVQSMDEVYAFFPGDLQSLVDWSLQSDPLQGVGLIAAIERKLLEFEESSQEFLARTLQRQHTRLTGLFSKFLDSQIQAIEDTKVKIKKRKGVIGFMRIFPSFSLALETMLTSADNLEIRETVNHAYSRINKAMFESLKVIARENPSAGQTAGADPEDKEALNYQILLIENMNHYIEEVDTRSNPVLEEWKQNAVQEMDEHMSLYVGAVIRRPLGRLLDYLESTETLMNSRQPGEPATKISGMTSHSKSTFHKVLAAYDSKEIKRGIETLKKRVEKHFGDIDDPALGRALVGVVLGQCEKYYEKVEDRILTISRDVYDGDVLAEWTRADVVSAFKK